MIIIPEIYNHFGLADIAPPHCFELENIIEMFIPEGQDETITKIIHLLPFRQDFSPKLIENLLKANIDNQMPALSLSQNNQNTIRFHILSSSEQNETPEALKQLQFLIDQIEGA